MFSDAGMTAEEVHCVLDALANAGCRAWVAGGWGVDALAGRQTRDHRDLDLAVNAEDETSCIAALVRLGYRVETDCRPVRVELVAPHSRWVDLHPVVFDRDGNGVQSDTEGGVFRYPSSCFVEGVLGGRQVACLSVEQRIAFHSGYPRRDIDFADLARLHAIRRANSERAD